MCRFMMKKRSAPILVKFLKEIPELCLNSGRICFTIALLKIRQAARCPPERQSTMLHVVLVEPEIPPNCGNIARTCAATGSSLHLVEPLGFDVSDRAVKRAGLDYWHLVEVTVYRSLEHLFAVHPEAACDLWLATTRAPGSYVQARFSPDCWLFFGRETAGLPLEFREQYRDRCLRIPMAAAARSLNLANSAAILIYEALRQNGFPGLLDTGEMGNAP